MADQCCKPKKTRLMFACWQSVLGFIETIAFAVASFEDEGAMKCTLPFHHQPLNASGAREALEKRSKWIHLSYLSIMNPSGAVFVCRVCKHSPYSFMHVPMIRKNLACRQLLGFSVSRSANMSGRCFDELTMMSHWMAGPFIRSKIVLKLNEQI